jgi:hypothetical protein
MRLTTNEREAIRRHGGANEAKMSRDLIEAAVTAWELQGP